MRKTLLSILGLLCFMIMQAQVAKTVNMTQAGTLASVLTADEKNTITDLTLTGPIDASDFKTMRDLMPVLAVLDMEGANIVEYSGGDGTNSNLQTYPTNEIPSHAFNNKVNIKTIKLPAGVISIDEKAFMYCNSLEGELKLPAGITSIGRYAFSNCIRLTGKLKLPASLNLIGDHAFECCIGFTGGLKLPEGIKSIGNAAFSYCSGFKGELELPSSLTSVSDAFTECWGLTSIRSYAQIPPIINDNIFLNTTIKIAFVPSGSKDAYQSANYWKDITIIDQENTYTLHISTPGELGLTLANAGGDPNSVTSLILTGELNNDDFYLLRDNMPLLHTINMKELSNVRIPEYSFKNNRTLLNIVLPSGLTTIGFYAFFSCKGLSCELDLPVGVTSIGGFAFSECRNIGGELNLPASLTSIGRYAFSDCWNLSGEINLPASLTSIDEGIFKNCRGLSGELNLPSGIISIGESAFSWCSGLTGELKLPAGITSIGEFAFSRCDGLTGELKLPAGITSIGTAAFQWCSGFTGELNLPSGITSIGTAAFLRCSGLISIHIKKNVKSIGDRAFLYCSNVSKITCETEIPPSLGTNVFEGINTETCKLYVPKGSRMNYLLAPQWGNFTNIIEMDMPSGIITPETTIRTWKANGQLFVESSEEMSAAEVVDMSGRTACSITKTAYAYVLNLPSNGVYLVRIRTAGGEVKTVKVAM